MTETDVIDRAVLNGLLESVGGDPEFLGELMQAYLDDAPQLLAQMQEALAAGNSEALRRAAHSLKSNSATFGAMDLSRISKELEEMGKTGALDGATERIAQAETEYARVEAALRTAGGL